MAKHFILVLLFGMTAAQLSGQYVSGVFEPDTTQQASVDSTTRFANSITADDMRKHLTVLASDEYEGRETGTEGNDKASKYIARHFKSLGFPAVGDSSDYFQSVAFTWISWDDIAMQVGEQKFRHLWDFVSYNTENNHLPEFKTNEVVFLGYGIDDLNYSDYNGVDVEGKVILIYKGEPRDANGRSWVTGTDKESDWTTDPKKKLKAAYLRKVKAVLIIEDGLKERVAEDRRLLLGPRVLLGDPDLSNIALANSCYISTTVAKAIIGKKFDKLVKLRDKIKAKGLNKAMVLSTDLTLTMHKKMRSLEGVNVMGYLKGTDPIASQDLIVVSAHYDHIGQRGADINNGADDNGSGTTTVLELAEAFVQARKAGVGPKRSVLFLLVTGEEKGLLGSEYYSENPVFPLDKTIADVNIDMVGRVDDAHADNPDYIYVIGSDRLSDDLHEINERADQKYEQLAMDYKYNDEADPNRFYYRSDHYNFAKNGIPSIFFFNGTHADYHRPSDTVDKIRFDIMEKRGRHIFHLVWDLANRDQKIRVKPEVK